MDYEPPLAKRQAGLAGLLFVGLALIALTLLLVTTSCATVGTGDPVIVRAEDVETNSLALFNTVIVQYHMTHSQEESPEVYASLEKIRQFFPPAWMSLHKAIPVYRQTKDAATLTAKVTEVEGYYYELKTIWSKKLGEK